MSKPICHRYFLFSFILIPIFLSHFILTQLPKWKWVALLFFITILFSGNFIFPFKKYGIGWDSNLAHMPYQELRTEAFEYLQKNNLTQKCATRFPFDVTDSIVGLHSTSIQLKSLTESSLEKYDYILQSNISTSFTTSQLQLLNQKYKVEKMWNKGIIEIRLYKKVN
jgi:hypothetical protein